ncbi:MAG: hypothetical protein PWP27_2364 [Clostridiales bacterium]|nr:hypothetical protein [Clostridiales bacterium]MDK2934554.1 hypothetical protein [Clostridiales bacterium]
MSQVLEMIFKNEGQKNFKISLNDPKSGLTGTEVKAVMDTVIAKNVFATNGGDVVEAAQARIINKDITELELV